MHKGEVMIEIRKKFWKASKELIESCNDKELMVLRNKINRAIEERLTVGNDKYLASKKNKLID